jgi:hypothetical protein
LGIPITWYNVKAPDSVKAKQLKQFLQCKGGTQVQVCFSSLQKASKLAAGQTLSVKDKNDINPSNPMKSKLSAFFFF